MPHEEFIAMMMLLSSGIALVFFFAVPIRKALLRKLEGGGVPSHDAHLPEEVDALRDRMLELEERLDFAERLIAQQRDVAGLPPGGAR